MILTVEQQEEMAKDLKLLEAYTEANASQDLLLLAGRMLEHQDVLLTISAECKRQATELKLQANAKLDEADKWKRKADRFLEATRIAKQTAKDIKDRE